MKTIKAILTTTLITASLILTACSGSQSEGHKHMEGESVAYYCPMQCEGDKTYTEEGACPVCGMDLVVVE